MSMILTVVKRSVEKNVKQKVILKKKRKGRKEKGVVIVLRYLFCVILKCINLMFGFLLKGE